MHIEEILCAHKETYIIFPIRTPRHGTTNFRSSYPQHPESCKGLGPEYTKEQWRYSADSGHVNHESEAVAAQPFEAKVERWEHVYSRP